MSFDNEQWRQFVEEVRRLSPIETIVKDSGAKIDRSGRLLKCLSPLRKERTPSFFIYPDQGTWWDFGPGRGGDVFAFIMEKNCCDFRHAVDYLAERCGKKYEGDPESAKKSAQDYQDRERLFNLMGVICNYYYQNMPDDVRLHLNNHYGITNETIDQLKIGWCDGLSWEYFLTEGYSKSQILSTGFFSQSADEENIRDFFTNRIIFPYWAHGKVVYAIGRRFEGKTSDIESEKAKYKKLLTKTDRHGYVSESITNKWFYNEDILSSNSQYIVVTEGVTDCIAFAQAGIPSISPVTVAFRDEDYPRLASLIKDIPKVYLCNDEEKEKNGRKPGLEGSKKTAGKLFQQGIDVRICRLPKPDGVDKIDVNEFLRDKPDPVAAWEEVKTKAIPYPTFMLEEIPANADRIELPKLLVPWLQTIAHLDFLDAEPFIEEAAKRFVSVGKTVLAKRFKELQSEKKKNKKDEQPQDKKVFTNTISIIEHDTYYTTIDYDGNEVAISTFALEAVSISTDINGKENFICNVKLKNGGVIKGAVFKHEYFISRNAFVKSLPSVYMNWYGTDKEVTQLCELLSSKDVVKTKIVSSIGYHTNSSNSGRFVLPYGTINEDGLFMEIPDVMYDVATSVQKSIFEKNEKPIDIRSIAKDVIKNIIKLHGKRIIIPIIGHCFASVFKTKLNVNFPILNIWGGASSGKSTVVPIIRQFQGVKHDQHLTVVSTRFSFLNALTEVKDVWTVFDEFRPEELDGKFRNYIYSTLRSNYNSEEQLKGSRDLTVQRYITSAPVVIIGESKIESDNALSDRTIFVNTDEHKLNKENKKSLDYLMDKNLSDFGIDYIKWSMTQPTEKRWKEAEEIVQNYERLEKLSSRQTESVKIVVFGILCFQDWAESLVGEIEPIVNDVSELVDCICGWSSETSEEFNTKEDVFDSILSELSVMANLGLLRENDHYVYRDGKLCIAFQASIAAWRQWKYKENFKSNANIRSCLRMKLNSENSYIISIDKQVHIRDSSDCRTILKSPRCVEIDISKIPSTLKFDPFPTSKAINMPDKNHAKDNLNL